MGVLINKKRCDNAEACPCIEGCPAKAFYYDKIKGTVAVHDELCINCRKCMMTCEAGAVKVFRTEEERAALQTEYDEDVMSIEELFQDRYGATSIDSKFKITSSELQELIKDTNKALLVEFYDEDEASCLINSIPIKEIVENIDEPVSYRKVEKPDSSILKAYEISQLPALVIIEKGKVTFEFIGTLNIIDKEKLFLQLRERD